MRVTVATLDLGEVSKEMAASSLRTVIRFVKEKSVSGCDQSDFISFEMSTGETKSHLVTLVNKLYNCVCVT